MRESDRLIRNIALCTLCPGEKLKDAEKAVRRNAHLGRLQNGKSEVEVLREMWQQLKEGKAWATTNQMIKAGHYSPMSPKEFDEHMDVLRTFQKRARQWDKTRKELTKGTTQ